jgi:PAP2 superfamily protein
MTTSTQRVEPASLEPSQADTKRRMRAWVELLVAVLGYELYGLVQSATNNERALALHHGRDLIHLERHMHLWVEPTMNAWIARHGAVAQLANYYYELSHVLVTAAVLIWLWRRHPLAYVRWRNALLGMSVAALVVFWTFPVAPPRFATSLTDTLAHYDTLGAAHAGGVVDLYAALPSLHVAWAVWVASVVVTQASGRGRAVALAYPMVTALVVLTTANHYVLDVVAGALLAVAVIVLSRVFPRLSTFSGSAVERRLPVDSG